MSGFKEQKQDKIQVQLGAEQTADFKLQLATRERNGGRRRRARRSIDLSRAGTADNISNAVKESLPTISRSLTDIVRISPMFNAQGGSAGDGATVVSVAGHSHALQQPADRRRRRTTTCSASPAPRARRAARPETQPISLDAIQEIQLVVSPYDVRQGGFTGGGINASRRAARNSLHGTGFFFGRNQDWVGKGFTGRARSRTFKDKQGGGSVGGPIVKNKAFFFGTADYGRKERRPASRSIGRPADRQRGAGRSLHQRPARTLYGYTIPGDPKGEFSDGHQQRQVSSSAATST